MSETNEKSSENDNHLRPRGSRKRQVHNELERRRKDKINGWIGKIGELLPSKEPHKQSKISLLEQTVKYIKQLSSERDKLLADSCSDVIANEINKLKKEISLLSHQNAMYQKLLQQSNISLSSLPAKQLKYTDKFINSNGVLTVKKSKSHADKAVQVSLSLNVKGGSNESSTRDSKKNFLNKPVKDSKLVPNVSKPAKIVSAPTAVKWTSCSTVGTKPTEASAESAVPLNSCTQSTEQTSSPTGGELPVMTPSPCISSKTIILPSGSGILQQLVPDRPSNTLSVLCPSILVPQQVFSVARNVGMPSTIICSAPVEAGSSQVEKSPIGSALLTINSNAIVPISTSFPANAQILLPSHSTFVGPTCSGVSVAPLFTAVPQASVPSLQNRNDSCTRENIQPGKDSDRTGDDVPASEVNKCVSEKERSSKKSPNKPKKSIQDIMNLYVNSPPSLQFLSANKIITLASQSQKGQPKGCSKQNTSKNASEAAERHVTISNNELDIHFTPKQPEIGNCQSEKIVSVNPQQLVSESECNKISALLPKSKFSLTVLIGDADSDQNSSQSKPPATMQSPLDSSKKGSESAPVLNSSSCYSSLTKSSSPGELNKLVSGDQFSSPRKLETPVTSSMQIASCQSTNNNLANPSLDVLCYNNTSSSHLDENKCSQKDTLNSQQELKMSSSNQNPPSLNPAIAVSACEPFSNSGSSVGQVLPSLFSTSPNSQMLACNENSSTLLMSATVQPSHSGHVGVLQDTNADFQSFSVLSNDSGAQTSVSGTLGDGLKKACDGVSFDSDVAANKTDGKNPAGSKLTLSPKSKSVSRDCDAEKCISNCSTGLASSAHQFVGQQSEEGTSASATSSLVRHNSAQFSFTSDILAKATESIFGNDLADSPQRHENCFADVVLPSADTVHSNFNNNAQSSDGSIDKINERSTDDFQSSDPEMPHCRTEMNVASKSTKVRKAKAAAQCEPLSKKMKASSSTVTLSQSSHINKDQSNLVFFEKQVIHLATEDPNPGFQNHVDLPDKTPDSLTPMLGDILKDVPHNANFDPRSSSFFLANESQASEKNCAPSNNLNDLNLPRMYFPILPEAPNVHVSFAHSVSLCSTQSDSLTRTANTHSLSDLLPNLRKKDVPQPNQSFSTSLLLSDNALSKQSDCFLKYSASSENHFNAPSSKASLSNNCNNSGTHFSVLPAKVSSHSGLFSSLDLVSQPSSSVPSNCVAATSSSQGHNFLPSVSQHFSFYPTISSSADVQQFPQSSSASPSSSYASRSIPSTYCPSTISNSLYSMSKADTLSHSLCSLLKESNSETRNEASSQSMVSSSNDAQSKYSALSLISDQGSYPASTCLNQFVRATSVYTAPETTVSSCRRNPKTSLSYSAESLLQTSCGTAEKNKNKNNARYFGRNTEKKVGDRTSNVSDNIFMPAANSEVSIQSATLIPLPPVTSFHNFSSNYSISSEVASSSAAFNSVAKMPDISSNENYMNPMNVGSEPHLLSTRLEVSASTTKPLSNIPLPFENNNNLYNNCNFLPHVKPSLENSRSSESSACFQPSFNNSYSQQSQKSNCCHFSHQAIATHSELPSDINLPGIGAVPSFHSEKTVFPPNRALVSQNNSNCVNNFFFNSTTNCQDGNEMNVKPSSNRASQEILVPEGARQAVSDPNALILFNSRKAPPSNRTKSKKLKSGMYYSVPQDCSKSYVPNGYFKSGLPAPAQLQCPQNKMVEAVMPPNPLLHQQGDNFLNLNFQHSNFPLPPTQPLSSSCLTTPIISHTFSSTTPHPVPNFNLSNILPDMGCSSNQVPFSPPKFPVNNALTLSSVQSPANSSATHSARIISHQSSLYPPMVQGSLNPIIRHNSQSGIDHHVPNVGLPVATMPQNASFSGPQNPSFQNAMHPFPRNDH